MASRSITDGWLPEKDNGIQFPRFLVKDRIPPFDKFLPSQKIDGEKCAEPNETQERIIALLQDLFESHRIVPTELKRKTHLHCWATNVLLTNSGFPIFRTAGKGTSLRYAGASGWAELVERLQIGYVFSRNRFKPRVLPGTKKNVPAGVKSLNYGFWECLRRNMPSLPPYEGEEILYIEFRDWDGGFIDVDSRLLLSSTGAAAGNTYPEALLQGLGEIFERYATGQVLLHQLPCPTIPHSSLSRRNQDSIAALEHDGMRVYVKDLSLGLGIPVAGLLVQLGNFEYNREKADLEFKTGSATSLDSAIERCLTELNQHFSCIHNRVRFKNQAVKRIKRLYDTFPQIENTLPQDHYHIQLYAERGIFPSKGLNFLLPSQNEGEPDIWDYSREDCLVELELLHNLCEKNGWKFFFKDFNFLGFPTVRVFVPELNPGFLRWNSHLTNEMLSFFDRMITNFREIPVECLDILLDPEFLISISLNGSVADFLRIYTTDLQEISCWEFFGLWARALGRRDIFKKYIIQLENGTGALQKYIKLFSKPEKILEFLEKLLPDCTKSCESCNFVRKCQSKPLFNLQAKITEIRPDLFNSFDYNQLKGKIF